jgi:GNAT superfamily N-acetyltransferase
LNLNAKVNLVGASDLEVALAFLARELAGTERFPAGFVVRTRRAVEAGDLELLAAGDGASVLGVAVLSYRPSFFAGRDFASVEDLYVRPDVRRRGIGRALMDAARERCRSRGVSYVEVQVDEEGAEEFYARLGYEPEPGVRVLSRSLAV